MANTLQLWKMLDLVVEPVLCILCTAHVLLSWVGGKFQVLFVKWNSSSWHFFNQSWCVMMAVLWELLTLCVPARLLLLYLGGVEALHVLIWDYVLLIGWPLSTQIAVHYVRVFYVSCISPLLCDFFSSLFKF